MPARVDLADQIVLSIRDPSQREEGRLDAASIEQIQEAPRLLAESFDVIVYGDVLEHLTDPLRALVALNRSLAPDGRVIASVPNVAHLWVRLSLLTGRFDYGERGILDRTHLRFFTRRTFLALLRDAGLAVDELSVTPVPLPLVVPARLHGPWLDAVHAASAAAARRWTGGLAYQFVAVCRRRGRPPLAGAARSESAVGQPR